MKRRILLFFTLTGLAALLAASQANAQSISRDSLNKILAHTPSFTIFKDNYFIGGTSYSDKPDKYNSGIKFQISILQRLTKASLPFDSYAILTYSQKSFWNVFEQSSPFEESNYNPTIGIGRIIYRDDRAIGFSGLMLEHESNGRDGDDSRSWNFVSYSVFTAFPKGVRMMLKFWYPFDYKEDNPELIDYIGYGELHFTFPIYKDMMMADVTMRKGGRWDWRGSVQGQFYFKLSKDANQYLVIQTWTGYAENLKYYKRSDNMIRIGMLIKANGLGFF
jgi:phospholipase A1